MRSLVRFYPVLLASSVLSLLISASGALASPGHSGRVHRKVCGPVSGRHARCHADVVTNSAGAPLVTPAPAGYGAPALRSAYVFPSTNLVANSGFESNTSGWITSGAGWFINGGASITQDTAQAFAGTASGRVDTTSAAAYQGATTDLGVLPAGTYSFSMELRGNAGGEATQLFAGNSGGGSFINAWLTTSWQTVSGTFTADGTHDVYIGSRGGTSVPSAMTWWTDGLQVVAGKADLSAGAGQTIAIVDAYDDPNAESDLAAYRSQFSLAPCTTANGCFRKANQTGGTSYPTANSGWAQEISLDVDMASAICPNCKILLVEASSSSFADLGTAEDYAAANANVVSNSYGGSEFSAETSSAYDGHYNHPGVAITVSSGDSGYGAEFPAASQYVTSVGGTTLQSDSSNRGWNETAWSDAGSGCSAYVPKPAWQADAGCKQRTIADVSADADPNTGVSVYDTYKAGGWLVFGGTSVAAPLVGSVYAVAGNAGSVTYGSFPYSHANALNDVVSGSNGSCGGSYLCTAGPGYDGPTGLGTPNGFGAF